MKHSLKTLVTMIALASSAQVLAQDTLPVTLPTQQDSRLEQVATSPRVWNGITVSHDNRLFASLTQSEGAGLQLAEVINNQLKAFPDDSWNQWNAIDPEHHFYHVNALRIGPDGDLWVMDSGNKGIGTGDQAVAGGAKLVHINLATGKVVNSYVFKAPTLQPTSYLDDVRFNGDFAYITDPGAVGLVVLNLKSGKSWRVLDNHPLSIDHQPIYADGKKLILRDGREKRVGLDQLEVSPDGKWLYYQAIPGPLARIETRYLNDSALSAAEVAKHAEKVRETWSTGGTAIDAEGNIYASDINTRSIKRIAPDGKVTTVVQDPRLVWIDAMWVSDGALWMPSGQINRTPATTGGKPSTVEYPVKLYRLPLPIKPSPRDHQ
ncbi:L-dopachrome tautomerase-related protein [Pantoea sp. EABMAA-21]|uniref:L-dopachrome tautomerase-related protein n=1 Tax=Pantoea sp. EABMAA-21 TaxID=3043302 RepID=UPI0024B5C488|nr:L-dopachrome tautomerase-related protein [Pantoea sp. EABMAA-21]MDI9277268.1 L-dopachrome tautomerase-related protein [Pantoea sp. EABMAA-21]